MAMIRGLLVKASRSSQKATAILLALKRTAIPVVVSLEHRDDGRFHR